MTGAGLREPAGSRSRENDDDVEPEPEPELSQVEPRPEEDIDTEKVPDDGGEGEALGALKAAQHDLNDGEGAEENDEDEDNNNDDDDDDDDEEDDEPKLKYARLTPHLNAVYRNGDMTSTFVVAGDKMIVGSDDGNISVVQLPMFQAIRVYHAHSSSVTNISVSPYPPPLPPTTLKSEVALRAVSQSGNAARAASGQSEKGSPSAGTQRKRAEPNQIPNIPSNNLHIATASMDGNVCVQSLLDMKDVSLRNFARPVLAVALSPDYKNDKTYLSGGKSGELVLTVNPPARRSTSNTVASGAVAAASGWLGSVGLGSNVGKDIVLHSGEGDINAIKWSLSGKYVVWLNEHGIKIMRSKLHLESSDGEDAWKRVGHIDRPQTQEWAEMASMWKGRAEWIDEKAIRSDEEATKVELSSNPTPADARSKQTATKRIERLLVGWGGTIWIIHVHQGGIGVGRNIGEKSIGKAEIAKKLRIDCIISGISLYTPNLLVVLAYNRSEAEEAQKKSQDDTKVQAKGHQQTASTASTESGPSGGKRRRQNAPPPELRLIDLQSETEVDKDSLAVSRYERLSSNDYHLGILPADNAASVVASKGVLEAMAGLGSDMWNAAINPRTLFNSSASVRSKDSDDGASGSKVASTGGSTRGVGRPGSQTVHPNLVKPGAKIFIHSPYDCILATKRDLGDHLAWLLEHRRYEDAWVLLDEHPEIMVTQPDKLSDIIPSTPDRKSQPSSDEYYDDTESAADSHLRGQYSSAEKEKRRIGEQWLQELVEAGSWARAGEVAAKVLNTPDRWEKWIFTFAGAKKFDEIADLVPPEPMRPPIPSTVYEIVLGHYISNDKPKFKELLSRWSTDLFDIHTITSALEDQLQHREVREDSVEDGEKGRDWRIVMESLAQLYEANGRYRDALKCYIKLQDAESAMRLIRDNHLAAAVTDDVPSFIALRVPQSELPRMSAAELEEATSEAITLLVEEAERGLIKPDIVVTQLERKEMDRYLYFYLRGLWNSYRERPAEEGVSLVDNFADLAVRLFATFDRDLLMDLLRTSTSYSFEKAVAECENYNYIPELVYLYSKTGQMKRALYLIIDRLGDVSQAISFAKEQDDPDLWEDLLNYSMDKPRFIRGLLEEVGTAINPITLVRRIPEGLEIPGLREGLAHIMKEHEIQHSISSGVARVLRSEVAAAQNMLRMGQRKGIKFEVAVKDVKHVDIKIKDPPTLLAAGLSTITPSQTTSGTGTPTMPTIVEPATELAVVGGNGTLQPDHDHREAQPGHCAKCHEPFDEWETQTLVGFACGHIYHLRHLLEALHPGQEPNAEILNYWDVNEDRARGGRFVGSKVTHARLMRDSLRAGCATCQARREVMVGAG